VLLVLAVLYVLGVFCGGEALVLSQKRLFCDNTVITSVWMFVANGLFMYFVKDNCYVAAWNMTWVRIQWYAEAAVLGLVVLYLILSVLYQCIWQDEFAGFWALEWIVAIGALAVTAILAVTNLRITGHVTHLIFAIICALSLGDGLVYRLWYWSETPVYGKSAAQKGKAQV